MDGNIIRKIEDANKSWVKRVEYLVRDVQYDHEADILYVNYGDITDAFSLSIDDSDDSVYLRVDTETFEIIGIEIIAFQSVFLKRHSDAKLVFENLFAFFGDSDWRFQVLPHEDEDEEPEIGVFTPASEASVGYFSTYLPKVFPKLAATA